MSKMAGKHYSPPPKKNGLHCKIHLLCRLPLSQQSKYFSFRASGRGWWAVFQKPTLIPFVKYKKRKAILYYLVAKLSIFIKCSSQSFNKIQLGPLFAIIQGVNKKWYENIQCFLVKGDLLTKQYHHEHSPCLMRNMSQDRTNI